MGRLEAVPIQGPPRRQRLPEDVAVLHAVQREAVCVAVPRRRLWLLLQQEDVQGGGYQVASEGDVAADGGRQEADEAQQGRLPQGRRLQPVPRVLRRQHTGPEHVRAALRRQV